jgi:hypothetical protein
MNKLVINTKKTIVMLFHAWPNINNSKPRIVFKDTDFTYKGATKFLGLYLTEDIKWNVHIEHLSNMLNRSYYIIQSLKDITNINILRSMNLAHFYSHFRYGILFGEVIYKVQRFLLTKESCETNW